MHEKAARKYNSSQNTLPTHKRALQFARKWGSTVLTVAVAAPAAALAGCGGSQGSSSGESSSGVPAAPPAKQSGRLLPASDFAWGHVHLSDGTFGKWTPKSPEPLVADHHANRTQPFLLTVVDGRFNLPIDPTPNPDTDHPTGLYLGSSQDSQPVAKVPDGTVLKVVGYTPDGQRRDDAHGIWSSVWERVVGHDGAYAWVPVVNTGFTPESELQGLPIAKP